MKNPVALFLLAVLGPCSAFASSWNDYILEIAPGFTIIRANTFDICITVEQPPEETPVDTCPDWSAEGIGPLVAYAVTPEQVLARHLGVRRDERNPRLPDGDPSKEFFFIMSRPTHHVIGPLSTAEFQNHPLRPRGRIAWKEPRNPNILLPLFGSLFFLVVTLLLFGWPVLLVLLLARWWYVRRRRRAARSTV